MLNLYRIKNILIKGGETMLHKRGLYIKGGTLIDGTGKEPFTNLGLLIKDNKIVSMSAKREISQDMENEWEVINISDKILMPGLIDCHSHMGSFTENIREKDIMPIELSTLFAARDVREVLMAGFTTVRYMGGRGNIEVSIREAVNQGIIIGPRLLVCGRFITCTGGLMDYYPSWIDSPTGSGIKVNGKDSILKAVRELIKLGVDVIKLEGSGATVSPYCPPEKVTLSLEEMKTAVKEAKRHNKKVAIHAENPNSIKDAIEAGVDTIEHGIILNNECVELMKEKNVYLIPTIGIIQSRYENINHKEMPDYMINRVKTYYKKHIESLKLAYSAGVKIALGTDILPGNNAYELSCMVQHCFKPMEAIVAGTKIAAEALGLEKIIGTIEVNKIADLILVEGNPLKDINILQDKSNIKMIIKEGKIIKNLL